MHPQTVSNLSQNLATLLNYPGSYSRHAQHLPLFVISDSAYREAIEGERRQQLAELQAKAAALRERLAAIEAQVQALEGGKPEA